jgi:hypothetical protein
MLKLISSSFEQFLKLFDTFFNLMTFNDQASNGREKQKTKVDKKKTVHLIGTFNIKFINPN